MNIDYKRLLKATGITAFALALTTLVALGLEWLTTNNTTLYIVLASLYGVMGIACWIYLVYILLDNAVSKYWKIKNEQQ